MKCDKIRFSIHKVENFKKKQCLVKVSSTERSSRVCWHKVSLTGRASRVCWHYAAECQREAGWVLQSGVLCFNAVGLNHFLFSLLVNLLTVRPSFPSQSVRLPNCKLYCDIWGGLYFFRWTTVCTYLHMHIFFYGPNSNDICFLITF